MFAPNRIAVYLTIIAGVAGAIAPAVANLDTTSTAGVISGVVAIVVVAAKWLDGWQKFEGVNYDAELMQRQVELRQAAVEAEAKAAAEVASAQPQSRVRLPR